MTGKTHNYSSRLEWSGATADGYDRYDRTHTVSSTVSSPPAPAGMKLSSDPPLRGNAELQNPAQLLRLGKRKHSIRNCVTVNYSTTKKSMTNGRAETDL